MTEQALSAYRALHDHAGLVDLSGRGKVKVTGGDHVDFLHVMISNDVRGLAEYHGRHGALLTPTGKLIADFFYYRLPDHILIDIDGGLIAPLISTLQKHIIMDDVALSDVSREWTHLAIEGPKASATVRAAVGADPPAEQYQMRAVTPREEKHGWLIRKNLLSADGVEVLLPAELDALIRGRLAGLPMVEEEVQKVVRMERGVPLFGVDFDQSNNPIEAGLTDAVSLDKGCYTGQEVISKATYVGGVSRRLVRLSMAPDARADAGSEVRSEEGKKIGAVTSFAVSPDLGRAIAFAYVKRDWAEPGKAVVVMDPNGRRLSAEVWKG